jgi:crotonobetainyl-CoA:carnitine CoA-transferase CaiB-like acyl-CoA transferase
MAQAAFAQLLSLAGLAPEVAGSVDIAGADPVLATRFPIATAGASVIAAAAAAAAELYALRNGRPRQRVAIDSRAAVAALRSSRLILIDGAPPRDIFDAVSGYYATRDGRTVMLHCNFPNHRAAALEVLGVEAANATRERVAAAVGSWDGLALEDAVHEARGCAALVRSRDEWLRHPQAAAVEGLPLLAVERIGDAPAEPLPAAARPLADVRVLDLTRVLAGPTGARALAEHGADVLKVSGAHLPSARDMDIDTGLGKLSTFLDLRQPKEAAILRGLIGEGRADVFVAGYRPGTLAKRGFGAEALAALRPGIVLVELSAWGGAGPWSARRGYDTIVQSASGMALIEGKGTPRLMSVSALDYVSGYLMALGAMAALSRRARQGGSWRVTVSLARTGQWLFDLGLLAESAVAGLPRELPAAEVAALSQETRSPLGLIRHLAPASRMSETPPHWARPPVPLGHDAPEWPPRA